MVTYQDFEKVGKSDSERIKFVYDAINKHKTSEDYMFAVTAEEYDHKRNVTIKQLQKLIYDQTGRQIPDPTGNGFKLISADFPHLVEQRTQYLFGNGVTFEKQNTKDKLGEDVDYQLQDAAHAAMVEKISFPVQGCQPH